MIEKALSALQRTVAFKFIIYGFFISCSLWYLLSINKALRISNERLKTSKVTLERSKMKLDSFTQSNPNDVFKVYQSYSSMSDPATIDCALRFDILEKLNNVQTKYGLSESIKYSISQSIFRDFPHTFGSKVVIKQYDVKIKFSSNSFVMSETIAKEIFKKMPRGSQIIYLAIDYNDVLNAQIINSLLSSKSPMLFETDLDIRINEIAIHE